MPLVVFFVTRSVCRGLARDDLHPTEPPAGGRIVRTATGGFETVGGDGDGHPAAVAGGAAAEATPAGLLTRTVGRSRRRRRRQRLALASAA